MQVLWISLAWNHGRKGEGGTSDIFPELGVEGVSGGWIEMGEERRWGEERCKQYCTVRIVKSAQKNGKKKDEIQMREGRQGEMTKDREWGDRYGRYQVRIRFYLWLYC